MPNKLTTTWKPQPIEKPTVNRRLEKLDALSRATECIRYSLLSIEHWISPEGNIREWLRRNVLLCVFLIIPVVLVMPTVGLILWEVTGWLSMITSIVGKLIVLPILFLLMLLVFRIVAAFLRR